MSPEQDLQKYRDDLERQRASIRTAIDNAPEDGFRQRMRNWLAQLEATTPEQLEEQDQKRRTCEAQLEQRRRQLNWEALIRERGEKYALCTLDNFVIDSATQRAVLGQLRHYASRLLEHLNAGDGLILYGPPGTGKDHLLSAMMAIATLDYGLTVTWAYGPTLFAQFRSAIQGSNEEEVIQRHVTPQILAISDPILPGAALTDYQRSNMMRITDMRYSRCRPTWLTINCATGQDARERLGPQVIDRLSEGALTLHCDWSSYRPRLRRAESAMLDDQKRSTI
jgi:DNA replication protein DnaC